MIMSETDLRCLENVSIQLRNLAVDFDRLFPQITGSREGDTVAAFAHLVVKLIEKQAYLDSVIFSIRETNHMNLMEKGGA